MEAALRLAGNVFQDIPGPCREAYPVAQQVAADVLRFVPRHCDGAVHNAEGNTGGRLLRLCKEKNRKRLLFWQSDMRERFRFEVEDIDNPEREPKKTYYNK